MGHKVHPRGFRTGVIYDWRAKWYADKGYTEFLQEDIKLRDLIAKRYPDAAISKVEIDRRANEITISVHTARPGIVIGRGGQRVEEMRALLETVASKKVYLNIQEIRQPELDAYLVAKNICEQIERRVAYRRAMKQTMGRTMQSGAKGIRILCSGRLGGAEIARREGVRQGRVPLHTLRADIDYGLCEAKTVMGRVGVKVWICKGEILPAVPEEVEVVAPAQAAPAAVETPAVGAAAPVAAAAAAPAVQPAAPAAAAPVEPKAQTEERKG